jgi:hypothetical protein
MKVTIDVSVPTVYQSTSARSFGIPVKQNGDGSISGSMEFDTILDARIYLERIAIDYYDYNKRDMKKYLSKDSLTIDAATAYINKRTE